MKNLLYILIGLVMLAACTKAAGNASLPYATILPAARTEISTLTPTLESISSATIELTQTPLPTPSPALKPSPLPGPLYETVI